MATKRAAAMLLVVQLIAAAAMAQEFSRVSGGELELLAKDTRNFSGSLGLSTSRSGGLKGYEATLGGTIIQDRLWFFAAAHQYDATLTSQLAQTSQPARTVDAKLTGQIGDRQNLSAIFQAGQQPFAMTPANYAVTPSSFLSLRYTGIVSSNMFFNATISRRSVSYPGLLQ